MTPQEHQLVDALFDRLAKLENTPRDPDAERLIADGTQRAPHGVYSLVQTALVQDEALKRANAHIEALQAQLDGGEQSHPQQQQPGFLDSMREAVFGRGDARGSVPTIRAQTPPSGYPPQPNYPPPQTPYPAGSAFGGGGSFLGTAASTAAGMIGGGLLLDGIRSMFGHSTGAGGLSQSAFGNLGGQASPWSGNAADSDLAKQAGIDSIGRDDTDDKNSQSDDNNSQPADSNSQSDSADWTNTSDDQNTGNNDPGDDQGDFGDSGGDTDYA